MAIVGIEIDYSEKMLDDLSKELYVVDYSQGDQCSNCGRCCTNMLPTNYQEVERIQKFIKKHNIQACKHLTPLAGLQGDMICPFRDDTTKRCTIYPVRPGICRTFFCGKTKDEIIAERAAMYRKSPIEIDMRATFFGAKPALGSIIKGGR